MAHPHPVAADLNLGRVTLAARQRHARSFLGTLGSGIPQFLAAMYQMVVPTQEHNRWRHRHRGRPVSVRASRDMASGHGLRNLPWTRQISGSRQGQNCQR